MRAAVVGTNWGQVHVRALRQHGVEVVALCGSASDREQTRAVANRYGVPTVLDDVVRLLDMDLDVVSLATPASTRAELLGVLGGVVPVLCEKPLLGMTGDPGALPDGGAPVWVNYAFAFLGSARRVERMLLRLGRVRGVDVDSVHDLPLGFTPAEWVLEVASHPLSFAVHLFGTPRLLDGDQPSPGVSRLRLALGDVPVQVRCAAEPGFHGLRHRLRLDTDAGVLELRGAFRDGQMWRFGAVTLDGRPLGRGEGGQTDCWQRANVRSIGLGLRAVRGEVSPADAAAAGLFSAHQAQAIDECVRAAFGARESQGVT